MQGVGGAADRALLQALALPAAERVVALLPRRVRDVLVPLIDVGAELGVRGPTSDLRSGVAILIETANGTRSALLVDNIQDQRQVVIKSLETNYMRVDGIAAATILGDGRIALIVDVEALASAAHSPRELDLAA